MSYSGMTVSNLRIFGVALAAGVIAFFIVFPMDDRLCCGGDPGDQASTCGGGPLPAGWWDQALLVALVVFLMVLVGLWAVRGRRHQEEGNT
jgi:hypothetical protein